MIVTLVGPGGWSGLKKDKNEAREGELIQMEKKGTYVYIIYVMHDEDCFACVGASCGPKCTSAIPAVPSLVAAEREGWV